jgi:hypothetical protein
MPQAMRLGDLAIVFSSLPWSVAVLWEMPAPDEPMPEVREAPGVDDVPPGTISIEVDCARPKPGDDARGSLRCLVI